MAAVLIALIGAPVAHAKLLLVAHRGASADAPENTLAAFQRAKRFADIVEFDVCATQDGQLVVIHDSTLERTTNGKGEVADHTLAEIRQLDAGAWFGSRFVGEQVPTVADTLAAIAPESAPFMERKTGTVQQFCAWFDAHPFPSDGVVTSCDLDFLRALKAARPEVQVGWIGSGLLTNVQLDAARQGGVGHFLWAGGDVSEDLVRRIHAMGAVLFAWTTNELPVARDWAELGVDGIITDRCVDFDRAADFASPLRIDHIEPARRAMIRMGRPATLAAGVAGRTARAVEWRRAGAPEVIGRGAWLKLRPGGPAAYGRYEARWQDGETTRTCEHEVSRADADNQLINISARMTVGPGEATGIVGFVVRAERTPLFLLRAVGPALAAFGVEDPVPNPALTLFRRGEIIDAHGLPSRVRATAADFTRNGAFPLPANSADVAVVKELSGGAYTVHLSTSDAKGGVGLIEVYQDRTAENWAAGAAVNLSLRGRVVRGSPLIGGFVVPDGASETVLIRGIGPSLGRFGVTQPLRDPVVRVFSASRVLLAENDDWWADGDAAAIAEAATDVGAFRIAAGRESAMLVTLGPGAYTALLTDASPDAEGVGLLEIYAVE